MIHSIHNVQLTILDGEWSVCTESGEKGPLVGTLPLLEHSMMEVKQSLEKLSDASLNDEFLQKILHFALGDNRVSPYWKNLAFDWLNSTKIADTELFAAVAAIENGGWDQALRHKARRLRVDLGIAKRYREIRSFNPDPIFCLRVMLDLKEIKESHLAWILRELEGLEDDRDIRIVISELVEPGPREARAEPHSDATSSPNSDDA